MKFSKFLLKRISSSNKVEKEQKLLNAKAVAFLIEIATKGFRGRETQWKEFRCNRIYRW